MTGLLESYAAGRWFTARRRGQAAARRHHRRGGGQALVHGARPGRDDGVRADRGRAGAAGAHLPRAGRAAQGGGEAPVLRRGRSPSSTTCRSGTGATRRDSAVDIDGGFGTVFSYASKAEPRAAQRHRGPRRRPRTAGPRRDLRRPTRLHLAPRRRGPDQRLQLPGLGDAREARTGVPGRAADDREAGQPDGLPHRARRTPHRRVRPAARGHPAAAGRAARAACSTSSPCRTRWRSPARRTPRGCCATTRRCCTVACSWASRPTR